MWEFMVGRAATKVIHIIFIGTYQLSLVRLSHVPHWVLYECMAWVQARWEKVLIEQCNFINAAEK